MYNLQGLTACWTERKLEVRWTVEPGKEVMTVKWGSQREQLFCVGHCVLIMLSLCMKRYPGANV